MIESLQPPVRAAAPGDAETIAAIYNEGIRQRVATFEIRERTADDVLEWLNDPGHPVLVAESAGKVVGWAASFSYRPRACYAGISDFSVYVATAARGRRVGDRLLAELLPALEAAQFWKVVSRLFVENSASRALCRRHGFREVGIYEKHARLDGRWRDVVIVERLLGAALAERTSRSPQSTSP